MSVGQNTNSLDENWLHPDVQSVFSIFSANMQDFGGFEAKPCLLVAVSGGADSLALCLLADRWARLRGGSVRAVIVDHGLRSESADEAAYVQQLLSQRSIPCTVLKWEGEKPSSAVQNAARNARYALLDQIAEQTGALHLLLGHHADDQRETVTMRMQRSNAEGAQGHAGMAAVLYRQQVRVLRPLLTVSKVQLENLCHHLGQEWVTDSSNHSDKYERNRVRRDLAQKTVSQLQALDAQISRAQQHRHKTQSQIAAAMVRYVRVSPLGIAWIDQAFIHEDLRVQQGCLSQVVQCIGGLAYPPAQSAVSRILHYTGKNHTLGGCVVSSYRGGLLIMPEAQRKHSVERPDQRYLGANISCATKGTDIQALQKWLKTRSRGENLPNPTIIRRFPVKMSPDDGCLVPCVGYSLSDKAEYRQKGSNFRFSPPQSLTYCLKWLAPQDTDIMS